MPRFTDPVQIAALQAQNVSVQIAVGLHLTDSPGFVGFTTGASSVYLVGAGFCNPLGSFLSIETLEDGVSVEARGCKFRISGIDPQTLSAFQADYKLLQAAWVWLWVSDSAGNSLLQYPIFAGRSDQPTVTISGDKMEIEVALESTLMDLNTPCGRRLTLQDSQIDHPGDNGLQFVPSIAEVEIYWGRIPGKSSGMWLGLVSNL